MAAKIANALVKKRLAACVQSWPVRSTFTWKGKLTSGGEFLLMIKAPSSNYRKIEKEIIRIHNYELPEIIALPMAKGSKAYLDWITKMTE
jgi:periplasmic divalent cation tolerance protein